MKHQIYFIAFLCCFFSNIIYSQNPNYIENLSITKKDSMVDFSFDISPELQSKSLSIRIEIESEKQKWKKDLTLKGDIGYTENKSKKHIFWIPIQDSVVLNENIKFKVYINPTLEIKKSTHLLKSFLLPGLGDYKARNGSAYIAQSVIAYGSIGLAVKNQKDAKIAYEEYKKELDIQRSEEFYKKAINKKNVSIASLGLASLVWSIDLILLNRKINKMKKNQNLSKFYKQKKDENFIYMSKAFYVDTRTEYELLVEKSGELFLQKLYYEAKENIEKAFVIRPKGDLSLKELQKNVELEIEKLVATKNQFDKHITLALQYKELNEYDNAILEYEKALLILPERRDLLNEIAEAKTDKKHWELLSQAKKLIEEKEYVLAIEKLDKVLALKYTEEVVKLLQQCKEIQAKNERDKEIALQREKDEKLASFISQINKLISQKKYEEALVICDKALEQLPDSKEILSIKSKCDKMLDDFNREQEKNEYTLSIKKLIDRRNFYEALFEIQIAINKFPDSKEIIDLRIICDREIEKLQTKEYKEAITIADRHWTNKMYDEAKRYYEEALELKPDESYPKERIKRIEDMKKESTQSTSLATLYEQNKSSVFLIYNINYEGVSQGSGFFITSSGIAVSNYHVFEGFSKQNAEIVTSDGKEYKIKEILEKNKEKDFIIFSIENTKNVKFNPASIASKNSKIGESVFAIGNPEGFELTLSNGIISSYRENNQYIQTTTPITHGSSGGPLFNMNGEVIGITTLGMQEGSLFFAINIQVLNLGRWIK